MNVGQTVGGPFTSDHGVGVIYPLTFLICTNDEWNTINRLEKQTLVLVCLQIESSILCKVIKMADDNGLIKAP